MGQRGVRRPLAVKVLEGERRSRINTCEPVPEQAPPVPPEVFTPDQREVWDRIVSTLTERGMAYKCDSGRIAGLAYAEWLAVECQSRINATGLLVRGANGHLPSRIRCWRSCTGPKAVSWS